MMDSHQTTHTGVNPIRLLTVACAFTVAVLAWLGWNSYASYRTAQRGADRGSRIAVLRGRILHLDEVLTMSARMAAATGAPEWEKRYRIFEPQLDAAITEARNIAPEAYSGKAAAQTDAANIRLVEIEHLAFEHIRQGRAKTAKELLFSDEYERQKAIYAQGMTRFGAASEGGLRAEEIRGVIIHLGEVLTMSARMAAATGDLAWEKRFRTFAPQLDAAINEAYAIEEKHDQDGARHAAEVDGAHAALVATENQAFDLVRAGRAEEAHALLAGDDFEHQKKLYLAGFDNLENCLAKTTLAVARLDKRRATWRITAILVVVAMTVGAWLVVLRLVRKWQKKITVANAQLVAKGAELIELNAGLDQRVRDRTRELDSQKLALDEHSIVAITDPSGKIIYVNDKFCKISQYSREELIGQDHRIINSGHHSRSFWPEIWKTISSGSVWHGEVCNRAKDGSIYWVETTIVPFKDEAGHVTQYVAIRTEITARKRADKALKEAKAQAEAANRAKSEFLANMSHEIRTPMTAILGFAEKMQDFEQSDSQKLKCVHTIRRNGEHLLGVINDILDLSKIEAGKMTVEHGDCHPCDVIAEVASLMRVRTDAKELPLHIEYIGAIPETIQSDPTRLRQILINLIGNAIKFTETGAVRLVARFVDSGDAPCLQFDVIDTGRGMTEEQVAKLFQPFMQADNSTTRNFGGTGLGLTISKHFAESLGGDLTVTATEMGVGTTFRATVATGSLDGVKMLDDPMSATAVIDIPTTSPRVQRTDLQGVRILFAEDGPDNQRLISFVLKKAGADVTIEENGKLALDAALAARDAGNPFDVILMDMQMPTMDGYEATGQLRRKDYTGPIIALTAHAMAGDREQCMKAGCDDYATKPIDRAKLIALIKTYASSGATVISTQESTPCPLVSELTDDGMLELVEGFVSELPGRIVAIERALGEQDLATLGTLSHQLRGSAGGYGFPSITQASGLLESSAKTGEELETLTEQTRALVELCRRAGDGVVQGLRRHDPARTSAPHELTLGDRVEGTVLVVDDDPDARHLFRKLLERDGFGVHEACDGIDALAKVADIHPHVILMDVEMPNMDGLECTRKLKAEPALCNIPVVIVSGKTNSQHVRAGLEAGAEEYMTKPIQHDEFLLRVRAMYQLCSGKTNLLESNAVRGEQARAMGILFDLSLSLAAADNLDAIAEHTVMATAELMSSRRVSVMLPDATGQNLFVAGAIGIDEQLAAKILVPVGSAISGEVFASGKPTMFNAQSEAIECTGRYESELFASVPLASKALAVPNKVVGVLNVTERNDRRPFEAHELEYLDLVCNMTASAIEQFQSGRAREHAHAAIVIGLAKLAEHRDADTGKHLERVTQFALLLARDLQESSRHVSTIDDRFLKFLEQAMPLHDIGKVSVPDAILLKPGKLTDAEFSAMKRHTDVGANALQSVIDQAPEADFLVLARDIAQSHHEWFDGSGYPRGLRGDEIPLAARIAAVADVYDALTTKRPYKEAFQHGKAVGMIQGAWGSHFDPEVVDAFLQRESDFQAKGRAFDDPDRPRVDAAAGRQALACAAATR